MIELTPCNGYSGLYWDEIGQLWLFPDADDHGPKERAVSVPDALGAYRDDIVIEECACYPLLDSLCALGVRLDYDSGASYFEVSLDGVVRSSGVAVEDAWDRFANRYLLPTRLVMRGGSGEALEALRWHTVDFRRHGPQLIVKDASGEETVCRADEVDWEATARLEQDASQRD